MIPSFIVDSSVALAWCFEDESTPATRALLGRMASDAAAVPALWYLEIANLLALAQNRKRIDAARIAKFAALVL